MTTETTPKKITITMSESRPLKIDPAAWPKIASASKHDGRVECEANHEWDIRVREHKDGRRIVYGAYEAGNGGVHIGFRAKHGGFIIDPKTESIPGENASRTVPDEEETIRAIRRVAGIIGDDAMGDECIGELPAQELT